jgi:putative lipoic acid-binding regulatory protein
MGFYANEFGKLELAYPCAWEYSILGLDEIWMRVAVAKAVGPCTAHSLRRGHRSRTGKYVALRLELTVTDEDHRLGIYHRLIESQFVKWVL